MEFAREFVCGSGQFILKLEEEVEGLKKEKEWLRKIVGALRKQLERGSLR